jgi:hypothetical protein
MRRVLFQDIITFFAAIVLLFSFIVGPSIQQASRTIACTFPMLDSKASIPFAQYVPRRRTIDTPSNAKWGTPEPEWIAAIHSSVIAPNGPENKIKGDCITGSCSFPGGDPNNLISRDCSSHSTVGICSTCVDVTSLVSSKKTNISSAVEYSLPNSYNISSFGGGSYFAIM